MAEGTFKFELVSPERRILSKEVVLVTIPGGEGEYGVLAGHAPMITTVKPGVIDVFDNDGEVPCDRIFVAGGFAEVTQERCTVLAEEAIAVADLNRAQLLADMDYIAEKLAASTDNEREALLVKREVLESKIGAAA